MPVRKPSCLWTVPHAEAPARARHRQVLTRLCVPEGNGTDSGRMRRPPPFRTCEASCSKPPLPPSAQRPAARPLFQTSRSLTARQKRYPARLPERLGSGGPPRPDLHAVESADVRQGRPPGPAGIGDSHGAIVGGRSGDMALELLVRLGRLGILGKLWKGGATSTTCSC